MEGRIYTIEGAGIAVLPKPPHLENDHGGPASMRDRSVRVGRSPPIREGSLRVWEYCSRSTPH